MDNAGCHPEGIKNRYINVKIVFLPPNTISKLQPLDLGIIKNFQVQYRQFLLRYVLAKTDECETASDVLKSIHILMAVRWVAQAWEMVQIETVCKGFIKAGILDQELGVVTREVEEGEDPSMILMCLLPSKAPLMTSSQHSNVM